MLPECILQSVFPRTQVWKMDCLLKSVWSRFTVYNYHCVTLICNTRTHQVIFSPLLFICVDFFFPQRTYITREIVATDGGNRSSSVELAVTITNVKNQPPQWDKDSYSVVISENTVRDTPIVVRVGGDLIVGTHRNTPICVLASAP